MKKVLALVLLISMILVGVMGCGASDSQPAAGDKSESAEAPSASNDYPQQQIKMIIPYGPGGATDIIFRRIAAAAEKHLGQNIVPVNMQGASSTIGSREVKDAKPDGYTILASHDVIATAYLTGVVDYSFEAFDPIALLTQTPNIAAVHKDSGWKDLKDLVGYIQAHPGEVKWGITPGSTSHFFAANMLKKAGLTAEDVRMIGYQGTGPATNALLAKEIEGTMLNYTSGKGYFDDGTFIPLGVAHDERLAEIPDVPTFIEQDINMLDSTSRGIFAPEGTPEEILMKIEEAFQKALEEPEVKKDIEALGSLIKFKPHNEYKDFVTELQEEYTELAKDMDLK
ncbi:MAG: Bug family tripartite tricarboxylate transporter substrate binding protein [Peptococcaceae bacterium]